MKDISHCGLSGRSTLSLGSSYVFTKVDIGRAKKNKTGPSVLIFSDLGQKKATNLTTSSWAHRVPHRPEYGSAQEKMAKANFQ